jgi:hypothetical protein
MNPQRVQSWQLRDPFQAYENCRGDKGMAQGEEV